MLAWGSRGGFSVLETMRAKCWHETISGGRPLAAGNKCCIPRAELAGFGLVVDRMKRRPIVADGERRSSSVQQFQFQLELVKDWQRV